MLSEDTAVSSIGCARVQQLGGLFSISCFSYTEFWAQGSLLILVLNGAQRRGFSVSGEGPYYMESKAPNILLPLHPHVCSCQENWSSVLHA